MIPLDLQSTIISELKTLFDGQLFPQFSKDENDHPDPIPLNIYSQALPKERASRPAAGNPALYMPYVVVQIQSGKQAEEMEPGEATILLHIGIYDKGLDNQGHAFVLNIIETIYQDLFQKRTLDGKYFITVPIEWAVNDEDVWPTFFGAIESHWNVPIILPTDANL